MTGQEILKKLYRSNPTMASLMKRVREALDTTELGFRLALWIEYGHTGPHGRPDAPWHNAVLKSQEEVDISVAQIRKIGLPLMRTLPKNWDSLAALDLLLKSTDPDARIFDAGGEIYSIILLWLYLYGYKNLIAGNLAFETPIKRGPITYQYADITKTEFESESFDAITSMSVIEHGVDVQAYFTEMYRILKPGGILITSTDYFETPIDTKGQEAFGTPIRIFNKDDIVRSLEIASQCGFVQTDSLDLTCDEKVVHWRKLDYTFVIFSLRKEAGAESLKEQE